MGETRMTEQQISKAVLINLVERKVQSLFDSKKLTGTVHLSFGQEAVDVRCVANATNPLVFGNHRSHGQYLAVTDDVTGLFRQLKEGKSQHLYYPDKFLSTGIQGGLLPVAFGAAQALKGEDRDVLCFVGDGTLGQGVFYETLGLLQQNPCRLRIIILDNNYSMSETGKLPGIQHLRQAFGLNGKHLNRYRVRRNCGHSCSDTEMYRPRHDKMLSSVRRDEWLYIKDIDYDGISKRVQEAANEHF